MNKSFDYIAEANVTASNSFHGNKVPLFAFQANLLTAIEIINRLDEFKKTLFYGRNLPGVERYQPIQKDCSTLPERFDPFNPKRGELLIHAIVGKVTEAGELLELLNDVLFNGMPFDEVNYIEEVGDGLWYDAIGLKQVDANFDEVQRRNIAKLRARFPNAFTEYDANNRDLFAERRILEDGTPSCPMPKTHCPGSEVKNIEGFMRCTVCKVSFGPAPERERKPVVQMENWYQAGNVLFGDVKGHPRLGDMEGVRTSTILKLDLAQNICETRNTIYKLCNPYSPVKHSPEELAAANVILDKL